MGERRAENSSRDGYKLWFDFTVLVSAHLLLFPLWLILWTLIPLLIWLYDRGPVFYRQKRAGKNGRVFTVLKFRTMVLNADRYGPAWTTDQDPRVTRVGKLLRRTALDELPELLSIWRGDMSLVGPRALGVEEHDEVERQVPGFAERLRVRPGLTGLAQIYDREDEVHDKLRYDLEYLHCMGPWLDVKLLLLSVRNTLIGGWDHRAGKPPVIELGPDPSKQMDTPANTRVSLDTERRKRN